MGEAISISDHVLFERDGFQLVIKTIGDNKEYEIQYRFTDRTFVDMTLDRNFRKLSIDDVEEFLSNGLAFLESQEI